MMAMMKNEGEVRVALTERNFGYKEVPKKRRRRQASGRAS